MPAIRLDWQKMRGDSGLSLFILPNEYRQLLFGIHEILLYRATFRVDDYDFSDWDYLQHQIAIGHSGLMKGVRMEDLLSVLDRIATTLEDDSEFDLLVDAIESVSVSAEASASASGGGCCDTVSTWRPPDGWEDDWPSDPTPDGTTPSAGTQSYICDAAHSSHAAIRNWYASYVQNVNAESPYSELASDLSELGLGNPYAAALWEIMTAISSVFYDGLVDDVLARWDAMHDDYICAMIADGETSQGFKAWLLDEIRASESFYVGFYMETLLTGTTFNGVYDGTYTVIAEYVGSDCSGCAPSGTPFSVVYDFEGTLHSWGMSARSGAYTYMGDGAFYMSPISTVNDASASLGRNTFSGDTGQPSGGTCYVSSFVMSVAEVNPQSSAPYKSIELQVTKSDGVTVDTYLYTYPSSDVPVTWTIDINDFVLAGASGQPNDIVFKVFARHNGVSDPTNEFFVTNMVINGVHSPI